MLRNGKSELRFGDNKVTPNYRLCYSVQIVQCVTAQFNWTQRETQDCGKKVLWCSRRKRKKKIHFEAVIGAGWSWRCERQAEGRQAGDLKQEMWELQSKCNGHKNLVSYCYLKDSKAGRLKMRVDWRLEPGETCLQGEKKTPPTHSHKK